MEKWCEGWQLSCRAACLAGKMTADRTFTDRNRAMKKQLRTPACSLTRERTMTQNDLSFLLFFWQPWL